MNSKRYLLFLALTCGISGTALSKTWGERFKVLWDDMRVAMSRVAISDTTLEFIAEECTNLGIIWRNTPTKLGEASEWARDHATTMKDIGRGLRACSGKGRVSYENLDTILDQLERVLVNCPLPVWKWLEGNVAERSSATDRIAFRAMIDMLRKERDKLHLEYRIALERRREA